MVDVLEALAVALIERAIQGAGTDRGEGPDRRGVRHLDERGGGDQPVEGISGGCVGT